MTKREVTLMNGTRWGNSLRSQREKCNSDKNGSMFKEERPESQFKLWTLTNGARKL